MRPKSNQEIKAIRASGRLLGSVLERLSDAIEPGMTTEDLNQLAKDQLRGTGGTPAFLGYQGFPGAVCVSVNDEVVHGIPGPRKLESGDIVGMDFGVIYDGMITDSAITVIVDEPKNSRHRELVDTTKKALEEGIKTIKHGSKVGDIGAAVQAVLEPKKFGIVRDLVGHGVGHELHESPNIPNYGKFGTGPELKNGMTIAVEPMATLGTHKVYVDTDGWTIKTHDDSVAAHFEHTILVTQDGFEVLTKRNS